MKIILSLMIGILGAQAEDYRIEQARSLGLSERKTETGTRQFLKWQNSQGLHVFIVDEEANLPPIKELSGLRSAMAMGDSECRIEVTCPVKAFCTGTCRNMYYEFSNGPVATTTNSTPGEAKNRCMLLAIDCAKGISAAAPRNP